MIFIIPYLTLLKKYMVALKGHFCYAYLNLSEILKTDGES